MTREFQVYQGAAPQSAQVGGVQVPHFANIPQNGEAVDAAIGDVRDFAVRLGRLHDLGVKQRVVQERERIRSEMDVAMQQAAALPMGSAESLFRKDGSVNSDRYDAIVAKYWSECDKIEPGEFVLRENAARYAGEQQEERNGLALRMMKFAALKSIENTRKAFDDNLKLAADKGDWGAAHQLVEDARGCLLTDAEADARLLKLGRGAVEDKIFRMTENDPEAAFDYLYGSDGGVLTPQRRLQLGAALRAKLKQREAARIDDFFSPMPASVRDELKEDGKSGKKRNAPEFWGTHSQQEIAWLYAVKNGQAADVLPAVRGHAMAEAMALSPDIAGDPAAQEKARAEFEARYLYYGMEKADVTRIWNAGMKNLEHVRAGGINPKMRLKAAYDGGQLFNQDVWSAWEKSWKRDEDGEMTFEEFGKDGYARLRWGAAAGVSEKDDAKTAYAKIAKLKQVNMQAETQGRILELYSAWAATKEGEQASPLQQLEKLNSLAAAETGHAVGMGSVEDLQALKKQSFYGQSKAYNDFTAGNARTFQEEEESVQPWRKVNVGYDSERKDLPRGILVPEEMLQGKNMEDVVYDMVFDNEHFLRLPVVGTTKGNAPVMTYATAREAGRSPDSVYTVIGKLRSGDSSVLLDEVERPVGSVRYGTGQYVTGQWAGALDPQRVPVALRPHLQDFIEAGAQYGVNPALLVAISMHETGDGTSSAFRTKKNAMGISDSRGVMQMPSVRSGIFRMAKALGEKAYYKGRSLSEIAKVYAPIGAENDPRGLNGCWLSGVSAKLKRINK